MVFVDTNVFMYAVGRPHRLQATAREFFEDATRERRQLCTSVDVLQELLHAYVPAKRMATLDAALALVDSLDAEVWPLESEDVLLARRLHRRFPTLGARDLCHLASCRRRNVNDIKTFDRGFEAAVEAYF
ncbi:MAG: type II toxin-antitoxin system VapC family toxin [Gammaproteobacteria bacterium]|nr:type II toxin-antitoxin system VapC family toxin [Gammaproteobacteria bacterium]